ncbi:hypothetical protein [Jannaschia sp. R86511]|uniref:hypothetical protein n=1 Tax=Jannaschia sp. R86511 TaxID=3093853 RepID=UPI0036D3EE7F
MTTNLPPALPPALPPGLPPGPPPALRPLTLAVQAVVLVVAEVVLYRTYTGHDAAFHWSTHFLVAVIVTVAWHALHLRWRARPAPAQLLSVLGFHLVAMAPDLLFRAGVAHERWMDVFLGHISSHYIPGGDRTWLALAVLAVLAYTWQLRSGLTPAPASRPTAGGAR